MVAVLEEEITIPPRYLKAVGGPGDQLHLKDFFSDEKPRLGVLSSLAAGADQICAETALAVARTETGAGPRPD